MTTDLKNKLKEVDTIPAIIKVLNCYYDLDSVKLGILSKNIMINNLDSIVSYLKVPLRDESKK